MLGFSFLLAALICVAATIKLLGVAKYIRWFNSYRVPEHCEESWPRAAIVVSLRGADPYLTECLARLADQDYPEYSLHIVIDHPSDPAKELVEEWIARQVDCPVEVSFLTELSRNAYLKVSAVRQCIRSLGRDVGVVVLADADTVVYRRWLRDIIAPLGQQTIGVVTGNRWYDPTNKSWGSMVRFIYNAFCVVPMFFMRATWGGSLAIRRDVFDQELFYEGMKKTSSEDNAVQKAAGSAGVALQVQPNVMILNREECAFASCFRFIRRQLIWTRLYHRNWLHVVLGTVGFYLLLAGSVITAVLAFALHQPLAALPIGLAVGLETISSLALMEWLHNTVANRASTVQDTPFPKMTWSGRLRLLCMLPIALVVIVWATLSATYCRQVKWRGITYRLVPPDGISMVEYRPYAEVAGVEQAGCSLS